MPYPTKHHVSQLLESEAGPNQHSIQPRGETQLWGAGPHFITTIELNLSSKLEISKYSDKKLSSWVKLTQQNHLF